MTKLVTIVVAACSILVLASVGSNARVAAGAASAAERATLVCLHDRSSRPHRMPGLMCRQDS